MAFIKKKLQDIADKSMESAENSIFKHKTENMLENCSNKKQINKKLIWALSSVATIIVIVCLVMVIALPLNNQSQEEPHYAFEFEQTIKVSIEELNNNLKGISFNNHGENAYIKKLYDDKTKDTLMFIFSYDNFYIPNNANYFSVEMHIVTNPYYKDRVYANKVFDKSINCNGYLLEYREIISNVDGIYEFEIEGKMTINGTKLYFEYQNIAFTEDSGLTEMLDTIISFE